MSGQINQKVRREPRFSMNQMIKYMVAPPSLRQRLIREQKYPPTYKITWYEDATKAATRFIAGGMSNESMLTSELSRLARIDPDSDNEATRISLNIEAIESLLNSYDSIQFDGLEPSLGEPAPNLLDLGGVDLSIRPEILLRGERQRRQLHGALKLYFSKPDRLTEETSQYGATLLLLHRRQEIEADGDESAVSRPQHCMIYDVFGGAVFTAPNATTQRRNNLESACVEIADRWPNITL